MSTSGHEKLEGLCYKRKVVWDYVNEEEKSQVGDFADKYKSFLDRAKTEREAVEAILDYARARGFFYLTDKDKLVPGDRFLAVNRHKEIVMGVIGTGHCNLANWGTGQGRSGRRRHYRLSIGCLWNGCY